MKFLRSLFLKKIQFSGDYADILMARRAWRDRMKKALPDGIIIISINLVPIKWAGKKVKEQLLTIYWVEDNKITRLLGFKPNFVHRTLMNH